MLKDFLKKDLSLKIFSINLMLVYTLAIVCRGSNPRSSAILFLLYGAYLILGIPIASIWGIFVAIFFEILKGEKLIGWIGLIANFAMLVGVISGYMGSDFYILLTPFLPF